MRFSLPNCPQYITQQSGVMYRGITDDEGGGVPIVCTHVSLPIARSGRVS